MTLIDNDQTISIETKLLENIDKRLTNDDGLRKTKSLQAATITSNLVEELKDSTITQLKLLRKNFSAEPDFIGAIIKQYGFIIEERRNLDTLGWAIFGVTFGLSVGVFGLVLTSSILGWLKLLGLVFSGMIYWYGHVLLTHSRLTRRIHRVLAMAIEDTLGWFYLTNTEIANKTIRCKIQLYIRIFSASYTAIVVIVIFCFLLNEILKVIS